MTEDHTWELLRALDTKVGNLNDTVTAFIACQRETCANQIQRNNALYGAVYGNGAPGLVADVRRLKESDEFRRKVVAAAIALILTNIGTIVTFSYAIIKNL